MVEWFERILERSWSLGDDLQSYLYRIKKEKNKNKWGCICMMMILNYVVQCSWCWLIGKKKKTSLGSFHRSVEHAVDFIHGINVCFSITFVFLGCVGFFRSRSFSRHSLCFACFACLTAKRKVKKKGIFLTLTKRQKKKKKTLGFLNVQKAIVSVKLLTVSWVFLNCWTKTAYRWRILYQRWRN